MKEIIGIKTIGGNQLEITYVSEELYNELDLSHMSLEGSLDKIWEHIESIGRDNEPNVMEEFCETENYSYDGESGDWGRQEYIDALVEHHDYSPRSAEEIANAIENSNQFFFRDNEVTFYLVNVYQAYRADETGVRWFTHEPIDTEYYKHEVIRSKNVMLPEGYYYSGGLLFDREGGEVREYTEDGDLLLVSSQGIKRLKM